MSPTMVAGVLLFLFVAGIALLVLIGSRILDDDQD